MNWCQYTTEQLTEGVANAQGKAEKAAKAGDIIHMAMFCTMRDCIREEIQRRAGAEGER